MYIIAKATKINYTFLKDQDIVDQTPINVNDSSFWTDDINVAHFFDDRESAETIKRLLESQQEIQTEYEQILFIPALYIKEVMLL